MRDSVYGFSIRNSVCTTRPVSGSIQSVPFEYSVSPFPPTTSGRPVPSRNRISPGSDSPGLTCAGSLKRKTRNLALAQNLQREGGQIDFSDDVSDIVLGALGLHTGEALCVGF